MTARLPGDDERQGTRQRDDRIRCPAVSCARSVVVSPYAGSARPGRVGLRIILTPIA